MILALTGGTGFVGARLIDRALSAGHHIRALTRRPQPPREGVTWIDGALDRPDSLAALVEGADAVIHVAGVVNAPDRAGFAAGNIDGTRAMVAASAGKRFVHVSSLAATEPGLSNYGWSKAEAETIVTASDLDWVMVRPPAIYGPGEMDMRDMFRLAHWGLAFLPPPGRMSVIAVDDLATLLVTLVDRGDSRAIFEVDDGSDGMTYVAFARAIGAAVGRTVIPFSLPRSLLSFGARIDRLMRGNSARLTPDRVAYLCHPDWTIDPARRPPADLWTPAIPTPQGLADTARWYRANGLL